MAWADSRTLLFCMFLFTLHLAAASLFLLSDTCRAFDVGCLPKCLYLMFVSPALLDLGDHAALDEYFLCVEVSTRFPYPGVGIEGAVHDELY